MLDTNVVLDWFVFQDPAVRPLAQAIEQGVVHWLGCAEMRAELAHVLAHAQLPRPRSDLLHALTFVDRLCMTCSLPAPLPAVRLRCSDTSDQMFIDLALSHRVRWLLTRDKALLKLTRKAAALGLLIQVPEAWRPAPGACG